jgi:hypothetical protein
MAPIPLNRPTVRELHLLFDEWLALCQSEASWPLTQTKVDNVLKSLGV